MTVTTPPAPPREVRLSDYRRPSWLARTIDLLVELHEDHAQVTSTVVYERNPAVDDPDDELVLDGVELELLSLSLDGEALDPADCERNDARLVLVPGRERFSLQVVTRIDPAHNTTLQGIYRSGRLTASQMEAQGFRRVTYFQDRPDVLPIWTTTLVADPESCPVLLSNGHVTDQGSAEGGRHFVTWHDPHPKPCYLFALVAGDLACVEDRFTTCSGKAVTLRLYVDPGNEDSTAHAMASLKRAMRWDEQTYGREYDLDLFMIVAVGDFNMGAMENKGLNIFNSALVLAKQATTIDQDFQRIEGVIGHEYFHNWSGNRVTCRDWFQLSLKEGFTVFRDQEFSADMNDRAVQRIADVRSLRTRQFPQDAGPLAHPVRPDRYIAIDNFYTATVYEKGAEVVRMLAARLGPQRFRRGCDLYFERHDGQAVTVEDFLAALGEAGGVDLTPYRAWYEQAGTPRLTAREHWDESAGRYTLTLSQHTPPTPGQPDKRPFPIPVRTGLLGPDGADLPLPGAVDGSVVLELSAAEQTFAFDGLPARPVPSLLRGFSAPVELELALTDEQLAFLAAHDADRFNRWEAGQRLFTRGLLEMLAAHGRGERPVTPPALLEVAGHLLEHALDEPAFVAAALEPPAESDLSATLEVIDVEAVHAARQQALADIGRAHRATLERLHATLAADPGGSIDPGAIGRRALGNACLDLLVRTGEARFGALAEEQLRRARTMTDELGALGILADGDAPGREAALAAFRERWQHDPLVMNKWFAAQAGSSREGTVEDVLRLSDDPAFDANNPNKLRALYRTFANNQVRFHRADGRGYQLLGDVVASVDRRNPIMAGRLAALAFDRWRRFDPGRSALMRAQLERLRDGEHTSPNVYEVASKSLA